MTERLAFLVVGNLLIWAVPYFLQKRGFFAPSGVVAYLFSSSYWFPIVLSVFNPFLLIPQSTEKLYEDVGTASLIAGLGFFAGSCVARACFALKRNTTRPVQRKHVRGYVIAAIWVLLLCGILLLAYCLLQAMAWKGLYDRVTFYRYSPHWYVGVLPTAGLCIGLGGFLYFSAFSERVAQRKSLFVALAFGVYFTSFINGFDGGRRYSAVVLFFLFSGSLFSLTGALEPHLRKQLTMRAAFILLSSVLFLSIIGKARNNKIGWDISTPAGKSTGQEIYTTMTEILCPTSTLFVNMAMVSYIERQGEQGYSSYFQAIGNTLFPQFIMGRYVFGEPLVSRLHKKFGWYGRDFGMLAEAMYADGLVASFAVHCILAFICYSLFLRWHRGRTLSGIFYLTFVIAMLNSLRSDFMNFLKVWMYFGCALSILYFMFLRYKDPFHRKD